MHEVPIRRDVEEFPVRGEADLARRASDRDVGDDRVRVAVDHLDDLVPHVIEAVACLGKRGLTRAHKRRENQQEEPSAIPCRSA